MSNAWLSTPLVQAKYTGAPPCPPVVPWDSFPAFAVEGSEQVSGRYRKSSYLDSWRRFGREGRPGVVEDTARACCLRDIPQVNPDTGYINYDQLEENARLFHPKLIIAGEERGVKEPPS